MTHPLDPFTYILVNRKPVNHPNDDEWFLWFGNVDNRRVGLTEIGDVVVSTIFGGIDRSYGHGGSLLIFETHVFGGEYDGEEWLTSTWEEAEAKHAEIVRMVQSKEHEP
jgi:hypothetical protein